MSRKIKFRAWDSLNKKMLDRVGVSVDGIHLVGEEEWRMFGSVKYHHELMQFTDLKDKNGVEIYEGDLIKWERPFGIGEGIFEVENRGSGFGISDEAFLNWNYLDYGDLNQECEVVGNKYENPELLGGQNE
jgi:uncharacterized phage protein (TIGR01671 family)